MGNFISSHYLSPEIAANIIVNFFLIDWTKKDPSKLTISRPTNFNHPIHVTYNSSTGEFDGMPDIWSSFITTFEHKLNKNKNKIHKRSFMH